MDPRKGFGSWRGGPNRGRGNRGQRGRPSNGPRLELVPSNRTHSNPFGFQAVPANRRVPLAEDHPLKVELADARLEQDLRNIRWARMFETIPEDMANPGSYDYQTWQAEMQDSEEKITDILRRINNAEYGTASVQPPVTVPVQLRVPVPVQPRVTAPLVQTQSNRGRGVMMPAQRRDDNMRERIRQEQRASLNPGPHQQPHEQFPVREPLFQGRAKMNSSIAESIHEQSHGLLSTPDTRADAVNRFHREVQGNVHGQTTRQRGEPFLSPPFLIGNIEDSPPPSSPVAPGNSIDSDHGDSYMSDDAIFSEAEAEREALRNAQAMFEAAEAASGDERLTQAMDRTSISREPTAEAATSDQGLFEEILKVMDSTSVEEMLGRRVSSPKLRVIDPRMQAAALAALGESTMDGASDAVVPSSRSSSEQPIIRRRIRPGMQLAALQAADAEEVEEGASVHEVESVKEEDSGEEEEEEEEEPVQEGQAVGLQKRKLRSYQGLPTSDEGITKKPRYDLRPRPSASSDAVKKADPEATSLESGSVYQHSSPARVAEVAGPVAVRDDPAASVEDAPSPKPAPPQPASHAGGRTPSRSLFIRHLQDEFEVRGIFTTNDHLHIVTIMRNEQGHHIARFATHETAKAALERQPAEHKVGQRTLRPGARRLPYVKWYDERGGFEGYQDEDGDEGVFESFGQQGGEFGLGGQETIAAPLSSLRRFISTNTEARENVNRPLAGPASAEASLFTRQSLISAQQEIEAPDNAPVKTPSPSAKPKTAKQTAAEAGLTVDERKRRAKIAAEAQDMMDVVNASFRPMPRRQVISHLHFVNDELAEIAKFKARKAIGLPITWEEQKRVNRESDILHYRKDILHYLKF